MRNENHKYGSSSNLVVISFLFQLSSSFLILLKAEFNLQMQQNSD